MIFFTNDDHNIDRLMSGIRAVGWNEGHKKGLSIEIFWKQKEIN